MPGAMPQNHAQALREHKPISRRLKLMLWGGAGVVVAAAVVAILLTTGGRTPPGCLNLTLPSVMGQEGLKACGSEARQTCASVRGDKQYGTVGVLLVENACRKAGLRVG